MLVGQEVTTAGMRCPASLQCWGNGLRGRITVIPFGRTVFDFWMSFSVLFIGCFFSLQVTCLLFFSYPSSGMQLCTPLYEIYGLACLDTNI